MVAPKDSTSTPAFQVAVGERRVHARERIGEPRAVDMHGKPARVGDLGELADLVRPIDRAGFGRLRERQHRRAHMVRTAPLPGIERAPQRRGRDLAGFAREPDELDAAAEEFRRAAFVGRDVRLGVAEHGAPRRREMRERQRVGRGPGRHQEDRDLVLEQLGEPPLDVPVQGSRP